MNHVSDTGPDAPQIPDIALERYRLDELEGPARHRLESVLAADEALRARVAALARADADARLAYPPDVLAESVRRRVTSSGSVAPTPHRLAWATTAAVAAVLVVVVGRGEPPLPWPKSGAGDNSATEDGRGKGAEIALVVYRHSNAGAELLADGDLAMAGDVVRVGYRVARPGFGAIVSVDGRGVLTQHWPALGTRAAALEPGEPVLLDAGFELDDAPRVERFYLIASAEPFDLAPVLNAVRLTGSGAAGDASALGLPSSLTATAFSLRKDVRP